MESTDFFVSFLSVDTERETEVPRRCEGLIIDGWFAPLNRMPIWQKSLIKFLYYVAFLIFCWVVRIFTGIG